MRVFCGSGAFCPKKLCKVLFLGTDSPFLKMGTFCRKFAEDVLSQGTFCPRDILFKFLGRKIHRTFRQGTDCSVAESILKHVRDIALNFRKRSVSSSRGVRLKSEKRYCTATNEYLYSLVLLTSCGS
jgi:hypothetical protein